VTLGRSFRDRLGGGFRCGQIDLRCDRIRGRGGQIDLRCDRIHSRSGRRPRRHIPFLLEQPGVDQDGYGDGLVEGDGQCIGGSARVHVAPGPPAEVELGEISLALAADQANGDHIDVEAAQHMGDQLVGQRPWRGDPTEGMGQPHPILHTHGEGELPARGLRLAQDHRRELGRQGDVDVADDGHAELGSGQSRLVAQRTLRMWTLSTRPMAAKKPTMAEPP
jgi:hypothetical protein